MESSEPLWAGMRHAVVAQEGIGGREPEVTGQVDDNQSPFQPCCDDSLIQCRPLCCELAMGHSRKQNGVLRFHQRCPVWLLRELTVDDTAQMWMNRVERLSIPRPASPVDATHRRMLREQAQQLTAAISRHAENAGVDAHFACHFFTRLSMKSPTALGSVRAFSAGMPISRSTKRTPTRLSVAGPVMRSGSIPNASFR